MTARVGRSPTFRCSACSPRECGTSRTTCPRHAAACEPCSTHSNASKASSADLPRVRLLQCLIDVVDQVVDVLEPDGQADGLRPNSCSNELVRVELAVCGGRRVDGEGFGVPQVEESFE